MSTVLAVDFGGTKTALARVDEHGTLQQRRTVAAAHSLDESLAQIAGDTAHVSAIGIVVPGIYTGSTGTAWCPNLWGADEVPLRGALANRFDLPVFVDSDRAGYVLGESWMGAARGLRHVVFVAIGTGIGVGILADGVLLRGCGGVAGAAGWFALDPGWKDVYGRVGCWEAEAAGPAIACAGGAGDAHAVVTAARAGDAAALHVLQRAATYTGMGIANLISVLNPEAVVLGGGLIHGAGDLVLEPIRREVARWAQPIAAAQCRIVLSSLGEDAGLFGAARLALEGL